MSRLPTDNLVPPFRQGSLLPDLRRSLHLALASLVAGLTLAASLRADSPAPLSRQQTVDFERLGLSWREHVLGRPAPKPMLDLFHRQLQPEHVAGIRAGEVTALSLNGVDASPECLASLGSARQLRSLSLSAVRTLPRKDWLTDDDLRFLTGLDKLEELEIRNCHASGETVLLLETRSLRHLSLIADRVADPTAVRILKACPQLRSFYLNGNGKVTDRTLEVLARYPNVTRVGLTDTSVTTEGLVAYIRASPQLEECHPPFDAPDEVLVALGSCRSLQRLTVVSRNVTDDGVAKLVGCVALRDLKLSCQRVTSDSVAKLAALPQLHTADLVGAPEVDDKALAALARCASLRKLSVAGPNITDAGVKELGCSSLEEALLVNTNLTDAGVGPLTSVKSLKRLRIIGAKLTDDSLRHLERLPRGTRVELSDTGMSEEAIAKLRASRPDLRIEE